MGDGDEDRQRREEQSAGEGAEPAVRLIVIEVARGDRSAGDPRETEDVIGVDGIGVGRGGGEHGVETKAGDLHEPRQLAADARVADHLVHDEPPVARGEFRFGAVDDEGLPVGFGEHDPAVRPKYPPQLGSTVAGAAKCCAARST